MREDLMVKDTWRVFRIMSEFVEGYETLAKIGPRVSIFGSARTKRRTKYYRLAERQVGGSIEYAAKAAVAEGRARSRQVGHQPG